MAKNKKPRKAYRPRNSNPFASMNIVGRMAMKQNKSPMGREAQQLHSTLYWGSLDDLLSGNGDGAMAATHLAIAANLALVLCEEGFGSECMPEIHAAQEAIVRTIDRGERTNRWGLTGPDANAIRVMLDIHEQQIESEECTVGIWACAIESISRRMANGDVIRIADDESVSA